ncbi:RES family NAD+ phosphorylase [Motilimonas pumila]|uniref:RES domain-containing protein n=1 Tax=Motilimonas pumila TaxID=2303987 RepID=A0A418YD48_9GAMM|nr:RES domain-containing protein [Motilimonas pumila]RJG42455.1 RES domain-containing protein [Motilimonas pumila]
MSDLALYRIVKRKFSSSAFDGEGARLFGGRWNSKGKACVYLAGSESLAILEVLVHIQAPDILSQYDLFKLHVPRKQALFLSDLPDNWRDDPAPYETAEMGDDWLASKASLALAVPSVIVPREWNFILNPKHAGFEAAISSAEQLNFTLDDRLLP